MPHILAVDRNATGRHIVEARQQRTDGSLSAAGRTPTRATDLPAGISKETSWQEPVVVIVTIMKGNILITHTASFDICPDGNGIGCIHDLRNSLHDIEKPSETGQALSASFPYQLYQNLDRTDKDANIQRIHCQVCSLHLSTGDQPAAKHQRHQIHQSPERTNCRTRKTIPCSGSYAFFEQEERPGCSFLNFSRSMIFIREGLYHHGYRPACPAGWRSDISDLAAVIHEMLPASCGSVHERKQHTLPQSTRIANGKASFRVDHKKKNTKASNDL